MYRIKRIYEPPTPEDGTRLLVDRLWPRGVSKEAARLDGWPKQLTPSNALRKWVHAGGDWARFEARYRLELQEADASEVRRAAEAGAVTLLTAAKVDGPNHVAVLQAFLEGN